MDLRQAFLRSAPLLENLCGNVSSFSALLPESYQAASVNGSCTSVGVGCRKTAG
jgi:hypothetical protein